MSAATDPQPIRPVLTDAGWTFDWAFFGTDVSSPDNTISATDDVSMVFAPARQAQPASSDVHAFTRTGGKLSFPTANTVRATLAQADVATWKPGIYLVELRLLPAAGDPDPIYLGTVTVARGLSQLASLGGGGAWPGGVAPQGRNVLRQADGLRVVRGESATASSQAAASAAAADAARQAIDPVATTVTSAVVTVPAGAARQIFAASASAFGRWFRNRGPNDATYVTGGNATGAAGEITLLVGELIEAPYRTGLNLSVFSADGTVIEGEQWQ